LLSSLDGFGAQHDRSLWRFEAEFDGAAVRAQNDEHHVAD
jgi:hypothetical protein